MWQEVRNYLFPLLTPSRGAAQCYTTLLTSVSLESTVDTFSMHSTLYRYVVDIPLLAVCWEAIKPVLAKSQSMGGSLIDNILEENRETSSIKMTVWAATEQNYTIICYLRLLRLGACQPILTEAEVIWHHTRLQLRVMFVICVAIRATSGAVTPTHSTPSAIKDTLMSSVMFGFCCDGVMLQSCYVVCAKTRDVTKHSLAVTQEMTLYDQKIR